MVTLTIDAASWIKATNILIALTNKPAILDQGAVSMLAANGLLTLRANRPEVGTLTITMPYGGRFNEVYIQGSSIKKMNSLLKQQTQFDLSVTAGTLQFSCQGRGTIEESLYAGCAYIPETPDFECVVEQSPAIPSLLRGAPLDNKNEWPQLHVSTNHAYLFSLYKGMQVKRAVELQSPSRKEVVIQIKHSAIVLINQMPPFLSFCVEEGFVALAGTQDNVDYELCLPQLACQIEDTVAYIEGQPQGSNPVLVDTKAFVDTINWATYSSPHTVYIGPGDKSLVLGTQAVLPVEGSLDGWVGAEYPVNALLKALKLAKMGTKVSFKVLDLGDQVYGVLFLCWVTEGEVSNYGTIISCQTIDL